MEVRAAQGEPDDEDLHVEIAQPTDKGVLHEQFFRHQVHGGATPHRPQARTYQSGVISERT